MVLIQVDGLMVILFRLSIVVVVVVGLTQVVVDGGQVVISVGVAWIRGDGPLERIERNLMLSRLEMARSLGVQSV
jgi:hypothetical protein